MFQISESQGKWSEVGGMRKVEGEPARVMLHSHYNTPWLTLKGCTQLLDGIPHTHTDAHTQL